MPLDRALLILALAAAPEPPLATFDGGAVTAADLEREVAHLPKDERTFRQVKGLGDEVSRRDWIERIALRRIAAQLAPAEGLTGDAVAAREAARAVEGFWLNRWRASCYGFGFALPSDEELRREIEPTLPEIPERLLLSHIFFRAVTEAEFAAAERQLEDIRTTTSRLAEFQALARERSASDSARRGGSLGWMHRGWLPKEAEAVLYALPTLGMSPPLRLRGGVHLFWVEDRRPAERAPLAPRLKKRRAELEAEAADACRSRALGEARAALGASSGAADDSLLLRWALARNLPTAEERARMQDVEDNVWLLALVEKRVQARLGAPAADELRRRYDADPGRFRSQRELAVRRLLVPIPSDRDPLSFRDALRDAVLRAIRGELRFEELAALAGPAAAAETLPRSPAIEVAGFLGPAIFDAVHQLEAGAIAGPMQDEGNLVIVRIDEVQPARQLTFAEAEGELRAAWTAERRRSLRAAVAAELLSSHHFALLASAPGPALP